MKEWLPLCHPGLDAGKLVHTCVFAKLKFSSFYIERALNDPEIGLKTSSSV